MSKLSPRAHEYMSAPHTPSELAELPLDVAHEIAARAVNNADIAAKLTPWVADGLKQFLDNRDEANWSLLARVAELIVEAMLWQVYVTGKAPTNPAKEMEVMIDSNSLEQLYRDTVATVSRLGRAVIGMTLYDDGGNEKRFSHSIGNHVRGQPELLQLGTDNCSAITALSEMMDERGRPLRCGELIWLSDLGMMVKLTHADARTARYFTVMCRRFYGHRDYEVLLVLKPDQDGNFPDDTTKLENAA